MTDSLAHCATYVAAPHGHRLAKIRCADCGAENGVHQRVDAEGEANPTVASYCDAIGFRAAPPGVEGLCCGPTCFDRMRRRQAEGGARHSFSGDEAERRQRASGAVSGLELADRKHAGAAVVVRCAGCNVVRRIDAGSSVAAERLLETEGWQRDGAARAFCGRTCAGKASAPLPPVAPVLEVQDAAYQRRRAAVAAAQPPRTSPLAALPPSKKV